MCLWEQCHLVAKMTTRHTNQINTKLAILVKTHQKDAMVHHLAYARLPSTSSTQGERKEPYTLSAHADTVADITRDHKRNLINTIEHELGEGVQIAHNKITLHKSAHYYSHFLQPGNSIALRVPKEYPNLHFIIDDTRHIILNKPTTSKTQHVMIGKVTHFLSIKCNKPWVEVKLSNLHGISNSFMEFQFSKQRFYLPFSWNGWTVTKHVHLMPQQSHIIYNHQGILDGTWATVGPRLHNPT